MGKTGPVGGPSPLPHGHGEGQHISKQLAESVEKVNAWKDSNGFVANLNAKAPPLSNHSFSQGPVEGQE